MASEFHSEVEQANILSHRQHSPAPTLRGRKKTGTVGSLQEQLAAKEQELAVLRDKTAAAASQLTVEKMCADTLAAQLTQKEQELSGIVSRMPR